MAKTPERGNMNLKDYLTDEIKHEKTLRESLRKEQISYPRKALLCSKHRSGRICFYYSEPGSSQKNYINSDNTALLRKISYGRYLERYAEILEVNINALEKALTKLGDYDAQSIIESLPQSYQQAICLLKKERGMITDYDVFTSMPSENPWQREKLTVTVSNGLQVRSKNEMAICEMLLFFKIRFRYEMRLELKKFMVGSNGEVTITSVVRYPDFTIFLPDGSMIFWEHCGLMEDPEYRNDFFDKLGLYYDNGIYPPNNLIITMDGKNKPFNNMNIRHIIETQILPYCTNLSD